VQLDRKRGLSSIAKQSLLEHASLALLGDATIVDTSGLRVKGRLRQQYLIWNADPAHKLTETEKIKQAAPSEVAQWVSAA
jgi:hypothetical protein